LAREKYRRRGGGILPFSLSSGLQGTGGWAPVVNLTEERRFWEQIADQAEKFDPLQFPQSQPLLNVLAASGGPRMGSSFGYKINEFNNVFSLYPGYFLLSLCWRR